MTKLAIARCRPQRAPEEGRRRNRVDARSRRPTRRVPRVSAPCRHRSLDARPPSRQTARLFRANTGRRCRPPRARRIIERLADRKHNTEPVPPPVALGGRGQRAVGPRLPDRGAVGQTQTTHQVPKRSDHEGAIRERDVDGRLQTIPQVCRSGARIVGRACAPGAFRACTEAGPRTDVDYVRDYRVLATGRPRRHHSTIHTAAGPDGLSLSCVTPRRWPRQRTAHSAVLPVVTGVVPVQRGHLDSRNTTPTENRTSFLVWPAMRPPKKIKPSTCGRRAIPGVIPRSTPKPGCNANASRSVP